MASKTDARIPKPPKPPEKPLMPYMRYSRKVWEQVKNSNPHLKLWEVGKIIGSMWRELPDDEKALYVEEYDAEKSQYAELLRQYQSSPAYQAWLAAKERAEKNAEEQDQERKQSLLRSRERVADVQQNDLRESYMLEDNEEDPEDQYTVKHVAAARFQRNHRLMQEVLSETRLPELGQLITQSRMNTLHLQVEQLTTHKRNMCLEIESCENRHRNKISRMKEESENFLKDYRKLTAARPMITENQFAEMIVRAKQNMIREEEERLSRIAAEAEARRKRQQRQQQQREMDMAAAAEAERRRQIQQPTRMVHSGADHGDRSANILIQDAKMDPSQCRSNVQGVPTSVPEIETPSAGSTTVAYSNGPPPVGVPQTVSAASQKFATGGHTQHHYPPPQSVYTPNPVQSHVPLIQRLQSPGGPMPQPVANNPVSSKANMTQSKKPSSSASSTSSGSSVSSSTSSTKKRKSDAGISKDKKPLNEFITADARGLGTVEITSEQQPKGSDIAMVSGSPGDYPPNAVPPSAIQRQHPPTPQQYMQTARPPTTMIAPGSVMPGMPVATAHQGAFAYDGSGVTMPPGTYYQQHMPGMSQSTNHQNYQLRPAFGQHISYNNMQYQPHPHSVDHSSVMYVQQQPPHMPPQPQMSQPHMHQPAAPPMMGQPQQHPTPPPPQGGHPHPGAPMGWHQPGPGYPNQFGPPPPRGYTNQPPVVYTPQQVGPPISHGARMPAGYMIPQHGCTSESGAVSVSGTQNQSIPAPPPYQHQQVQQPPGGGIHPGYWSAVPQSHQIPVEYGSGSQQAASQHHYMPVPQHPQQQVEAGVPQSSQMASMAPNSSVGPSSSSVDGVPGHMHADAGQAHIGSHQTSVYYQVGYGPSNMTSGSVAPPPQSSSYYGMQTEQQHPGSGPVVSGHYPHNPSVQQMPQAGAWPGHYSSMSRTPHQSYPHGQPPPPAAQLNHPKVPDLSVEQTSTPGAPVASGPPSRPPSVSSNSAAPPST